MDGRTVRFPMLALIKNFGAPVKPARSRRCKSTTVKE